MKSCATVLEGFELDVHRIMLQTNLTTFAWPLMDEQLTADGPRVDSRKFTSLALCSDNDPKISKDSLQETVIFCIENKLAHEMQEYGVLRISRGIRCH